MAQKFIITRKGYFRLGEVKMHRDLLLPGDICIGGGNYRLDYLSCRLVLEGASYDYGMPQWDFLFRENIAFKVPAVYCGLSIVYLTEDQGEDDIIVTQRLTIHYI